MNEIRPTHCVRGHEWKPETTYISLDGLKRTCRLCKRQQEKEYKERLNKLYKDQPRLRALNRENFFN